MSMRIVPASKTTSTFSQVSQSTSAPSAPGVHDTLRAGLAPAVPNDGHDAENPDSAHPLEARLKSWQATQDNLRMEMLRRMYGMAEPIRQCMELKIVRDTTWRPAALGGHGPSVHEDILRGTDTSVAWEDVFTGDEMRSVPGFHDEMERKLKI